MDYKNTILFSLLGKNKFIRLSTFIFFLTLPIIIYTWRFSITYRHGVFGGEDWDEFAQMYESARITIIHYHQFPWWNSWSVGGEPLFANPQFGLFSIPMILTLIFGTVVGLHLTVMAYFILGFWGMYLLTRRISPNKQIINILLSYIWTFSGFSMWHLLGGHLTFGVYLLTPWVFLTLLNIEKRFGWLMFGLTTTFIVQTAPHYITVQTLLICIAISIIRIFIKQNDKRLSKSQNLYSTLKPYIYGYTVFLVLSCVKLLYTFQFSHEYTRLTNLDPPESLSLFVASILFRHPVSPSLLSNTPYGWVEYGNYIGVITLALFAYLLIRKFEKSSKIKVNEWLLIGGILLSAMLCFGAFSWISPFSILHKLPIFNQARVPARYICWFSLGIILFLTKLPKKPIIYILLSISVIDVFSANFGQLNQPQSNYLPATISSRQFEQYAFFEANSNLGQIGVLGIQNLRLLRATQSNFGEIYGYDPVLNIGEYYYLPGTALCGINNGCSFVLTHNAKVASWSPNKIVLQRTGDGTIRINMNPGKIWSVNGKNVFANYKIIELNKPFLITDPSKVININYSPRL